jgi:DNA-binding response OmpR family regulator/predicted ATPase
VEPQLLGSVRVDLERRCVEREGRREHLTTLEAETLRYLLQVPRTVSREELLKEVWGYPDTVMTRAVDTTIRRLRTKIEDDPSEPQVILTMHGSGYRLVRTHPAERAPSPPSAAPAPEGSPKRYSLGGRTIDLDRMMLETSEGPVTLTGREVELLQLLLEAKGASLEREWLQRRIWRSAANRALDNLVCRLRKKIEPDAARPRYLLTTAWGYRLDLPELVAPPRAPSLRPLPAELDRRFGREEDIEQIVGHLQQGERLVALTGPAGVGKTRLLLAVGHRLEQEGRRVVWVDAVSASTLEGLYLAMASGLKLQLTKAEPLSGLLHFLSGEGALVLLLDNLEQLEGVGGPLEQLLKGAPQLVMLVTSRVVLRARGERNVAVLPLPTADAAALFEDRAARALRPDERREVQLLVEGLEGLPLAIELAAARTRSMSIEQIRAQTHASLRLLSGGPPERSRNMRASLEASWALLGPVHRAALAQLSVWSGPFLLEAAQEVLQLDPPHWIPDVLQELCDASLLRFDAESSRFLVLAVIREYAAEQLSGAERQSAELRHGRYHAGLLQAWGASHPDVRAGPRGSEILAHLSAALPDLEGAIERALARGDAEVAVDAAKAAWLLWGERSPCASVVRTLERLLALELSVGQRARIERWMAHLRAEMGQLALSFRHASEALVLAQRAGDKLTEHGARMSLWRVHGTRGDYTLGQAEVEEALLVARQCGSWSAEGHALVALARSYEHADCDRARQLLLEVSQLAQMHDSTSLQVTAALRLAQVAIYQRHFDEAKHQLALARRLSEEDDLQTQQHLNDKQAYLSLLTGSIEESLLFERSAEQYNRRLGNRLGEAISLTGQGWSLAWLGRWEEGERAHLRALGMLREIGARHHECLLLNKMGTFVSERTDGRQSPQQSLRYFRQALDLAVEIGSVHEEALSGANVGLAYSMRGQVAAGLALLEYCLQLACQTGDHNLETDIRLVLGETLADEGRLEEAREQALLARAIEDRIGADLLLVCIEARQGRIEVAQQILQQTAPPDRYTVDKYWFAQAELAHARGDTPAMRHALEQAQQTCSPSSLGPRFRALCTLAGL